jgi:hypothetical protein
MAQQASQLEALQQANQALEDQLASEQSTRESLEWTHQEVTTKLEGQASVS